MKNKGCAKFFFWGGGGGKKGVMGGGGGGGIRCIMGDVQVGYLRG